MLQYELNKIAHGSTAAYEVLDNCGSRVGTASFPLFLAWVDPISLSLFGTDSTIAPSFVRSAVLPVGAPMDVTTDGAARGIVCGATAGEVVRYTPETLYHASIDGLDYTAYAVGRWRKGRFLCVYRRDGDHETQVAQVDLPTIIDNWLTRNVLHAIDERTLFVSMLLMLYLEYSQECHRLECPVRAKDVRLKLTWNKQLKAKYDPSFLNRLQS